MADDMPMTRDAHDDDRPRRTLPTSRDRRERRPHGARLARLLGVLGVLAASRRWSRRTRSATSRSTTTPGSASSPTGSSSTSSSTRRRSRPSRHASTSTPMATARCPTRRPTPAAVTACDELAAVADADGRRRSRRRSTLTEAGLTFPAGRRWPVDDAAWCAASARRSAARSRPGTGIDFADTSFARAARLARDRGRGLRRDARRRPTATLRTDERLGAADGLPDEPADPGPGRHVGRDRRHARRADAAAVRHPGRDAAARRRPGRDVQRGAGDRPAARGTAPVVAADRRARRPAPVSRAASAVATCRRSSGRPTCRRSSCWCRS